MQITGTHIAYLHLCHRKLWLFANGHNMDHGIELVTEMLRLCRRYLLWVQNSVFEGEIMELKLKELIFEARQIMDEDYDSLIIFSSRNESWLDKQIIGQDKNELDNIL